MNWNLTTNPWHSDHVEIDAHLTWRMTREGKKTTDAKTWMFALLELADGVDVAGFENELEKPEFAGWKAHIQITESWRSFARTTGVALDTGGFVTALITPAFVTAVIASEDRAKVLLRSLSVARDADISRERSAVFRNLQNMRVQTPFVARVIMGIIDDALPLAHPRFQTDVGGGKVPVIALGDDSVSAQVPEPAKSPLSRWRAAWLQGASFPQQQVKSGVSPADERDDFYWDNADINKVLLRSGGNQTRAMGDLELINLSREGGSRLLRRAAHGFHVADLMAGYEPDDCEGAARPMIGVQLPVAASKDASGLSLAAYVVDALAFILANARSLMLEAKRDLPIVVNLSYGVFTGAHDGSSQLERALSHIVDSYNAKFSETPLILTLPAGNTLQARGHACLTLAADGTAPAITWRILPDSGATALLELWWPADAADGSATLTPPSGPSVTVSAAAPFAQLLDAERRIIGQAAFIAPAAATGQTRSMIAIAVAPTSPMHGADNMAAAPHGRWQISVTGKPGDVVHLWLARGDTPYGFSKRGRQSFLEDPNYQVADRFGRPAVTDSPDSLVKRGGSMSGLATARSSDIIAVGAWDDGANEPSRYSSAGYPLSGAEPGPGVAGPVVMAIADQGRSLSGVLAAGVIGGSYVALNGTSVAAPQVARAIADQLAQWQQTGAPSPMPDGKDMAEKLVPSKGKNLAPEPVAGKGAVPVVAEQRLKALWQHRRG